MNQLKVVEVIQTENEAMLATTQYVKKKKLFFLCLDMRISSSRFFTVFKNFYAISSYSYV